MRCKKEHIHIIFCYSVLFILTCCNEPEDIIVYNNKDLIFPRAAEITVSPYEYIDSINNKTYSMSGDTITDTLGSSPEFQWEAVLSDVLTLALFNEPIVVLDNEIQNPEAIIWQWHSSMISESFEIEEKSYTKVQYNWGKTVLNKKIQYDTQPFPLQNGLYFWAIWSWDRSGRWILYSSKPMKFLVE